jgi:predicted nucleic acid-binding protein
MKAVKKPLRVYADTSVFGGCFDDEFKTESVRFFEEVQQGQFFVVVSNVTLDELELAPDPVRSVLADLKPQHVEIVSTSPESEDLRDAYLEAAVVGPASSNDAAHIAVATIYVDLVVNWNFKHIVHFEKIGGYEGVNSLRGYRSPRIYSPPRGRNAMKAGKEFDCVEMKAEIQQRLLREVAELGEEEAKRRRAARLSGDPILGSFLRTKLTNSKRSAKHTPAA